MFSVIKCETHIGFEKNSFVAFVKSLSLSVNYVLIVLRILSAGFIERAPGDCRVDF